jgi:LuxR family maltose regulon positive regulatory protein
LALGPQHNDARRFVRDVRRVLDRATAGPAITLVLDDFHVLVDPVAHDACARLIEYAPQPLHIVIATRLDVPPRYYRFRLTVGLCELRAEDLRFTPGEAAELLREAAGVEASSSQVETLLARTEGWPVALALAADEVRMGGNVDAVVEAFGGDHHFVVDYLNSEVLADETDDVRHFLRQTSVLDRVSGPLCDHVTGRIGSHTMLDALHRRSMLVATVDRQEGWYCYNELFRTFLRHQLLDTDPDAEERILLSAAEWHSGRGDVEVAMNYLVQAGAWDAVVTTALEHSGLILGQRRAREVVGWIERVPVQTAQRHVRVLLLQAAAAIFSGDLSNAHEILDVIGQRGFASPGESIVIDLITARCLLVGGANAEAQHLLLSVLGRIDSVSPQVFPDVLGLTGSRADVRAAALVTFGNALMWVDRCTEARAAFAAVPDEAHAIWRTLALSALALLDAWRGRLTDAEHLAQMALSMQAQTHIDEAGVLHAGLALAVVARQRDEMDRAGQLIEALVKSSTRSSPRASRPVFDAWIALEEAHLALASGEPEAGLAVLAGQRTVVHPSISPSLLASIGGAEAMLQLAQGDVDRAAVTIESSPCPEHPDVLAARVRLAVETGDALTARTVIDRWPPRSSVERDLDRIIWSAVVSTLEGDDSNACMNITAVLPAAELEGNVGLFRSIGPFSLRVLRRLDRVITSPFLRTIIDRPAPARHAKNADGLAEQLTEREYSVLALLPTRDSSGEIAARLGVSLNTVKTHLKHIYRKLDASGRQDAVDVAERLHLL